MRPIALLSKQAFVSILGALGQGAAGTPGNNNLSQQNAAPIALGAVLNWTSSAFTSRTGKVLVLGTMTMSKGGGTLVAADQVIFVLVRDQAGANIPISASVRIGAVTTGADVCAIGFAAVVDSPPTGAHTYTIQASAVHTGTVLTAEASITAIDV